MLAKLLDGITTVNVFRNGKGAWCRCGCAPARRRTGSARAAGSRDARTHHTTEYAPLSRAHCCFFCWTNDAGLLTDSIAPQYSLHFLMPRIAHTLRFVLPERSYDAPVIECFLKTDARALPASARLGSLRACTHCPRLLDPHYRHDSITKQIVFFKLTAITRTICV